MKNITCCFTGHRIIPREKYGLITCRLEAEITELINKGVIYFKAGGATGFDTIAALAVLKIQKSYPQIKLILVLPCKTQAKYLNPADAVIYEKIKASSDEYYYISERYTRGCMHKRNRLLVEGSGFCICYLNSDSGGTAYTAEYARKNGLTVINIAAEDEFSHTHDENRELLLLE